MWLWEKFWNGNEWLLRAATLPWLALGLAAIPRRQPFFTILFLVSPFVWYYLNEARPYTPQICSSLLLLGSIWRLQQCPPSEEKNVFRAFALGLVLLAGSTILGPDLDRRHLPVSAILSFRARNVCGWCGHTERPPLTTVILLVALAAYYLWRRCSATGSAQGENGADTAAFICYELLWRALPDLYRAAAGLPVNTACGHSPRSQPCWDFMPVGDRERCFGPGYENAAKPSRAAFGWGRWLRSAWQHCC
jgi:hypothetical protein